MSGQWACARTASDAGPQNWKLGRHRSAAEVCLKGVLQTCGSSMSRSHDLAYGFCLSLFGFAAVWLTYYVYTGGDGESSTWWIASGLAGISHFALTRAAPPRTPESWRHGLSASIVASGACAALGGVLAMVVAFVVLSAEPQEFSGIELPASLVFGFIALLLMWPSSFIAHLLAWALLDRLPARR